MKYIKTYETVENKPKKGDFVLMKYPYREPSFYDKTEKFQKLKEFLENNIGMILYILPFEEISTDLTILYEDVPPEIQPNMFSMVQGGWVMNFNHINIIAHDKSKKKLKLKLITDKYNL